jgi:hypothetical protein
LLGTPQYPLMRPSLDYFASDLSLTPPDRLPKLALDTRHRAERLLLLPHYMPRGGGGVRGAAGPRDLLRAALGVGTETLFACFNQVSPSSSSSSILGPLSPTACGRFVPFPDCRERRSRWPCSMRGWVSSVSLGRSYGCPRCTTKGRGDHAADKIRLLAQLLTPLKLRKWLLAEAPPAAFRTLQSYFLLAWSTAMSIWRASEQRT